MEWDNDKECFVVELCDGAESYVDWLQVIQFGMPSLMKNQKLLVELITRRAEIMSKAGSTGRKVSDDAAMIFGDLNLRLEVCND